MFRTEGLRTGPDAIGPLARRIGGTTADALADLDKTVPAAHGLVESPFVRRARERLLPGSDRTGSIYHG